MAGTHYSVLEGGLIPVLENYKKVWTQLDKLERQRAALLLSLLILVTFAQTLGVAAIMPFIAVLSNSDVVETNRHMAGTAA